MLDSLKKFDQLLRGDLQDPDSGEPGIRFPMVRVIILSIILAMVFGASIGTFTAVGAVNRNDGLMQIVASIAKTPLLFYLTLIVTFPSLYVFNALMGSRLNVLAALRLLIAAIAVMVAILASLGPIIVFFAFSTPAGEGGYRFILLLVVILSAGAGILGLNYLLRMLNRFADDRVEEVEVEVEVVTQRGNSSADGTPSTSEAAVGEAAGQTQAELVRPSSGLRYQSLPQRASPGSSASIIFRVWVIVFAIVGAQMSWVLRPFVGSPSKPFSWFREREGNFFQTVFDVIWNMLNGS